jgi:hypothetical protein
MTAIHDNIWSSCQSMGSITVPMMRTDMEWKHCAVHGRMFVGKWNWSIGVGRVPTIAQVRLASPSVERWDGIKACETLLKSILTTIAMMQRAHARFTYFIISI